jgi:hypothetical protein
MESSDVRSLDRIHPKVVRVYIRFDAGLDGRSENVLVDQVLAVCQKRWSPLRLLDLLESCLLEVSVRPGCRIGAGE